MENISPIPRRSGAALKMALLALLLVALTTWLLLQIQLFLIAREAEAYVRPFGIAYLLPVALLARFGGRAVGWGTLALSLLCAVYVLMQPRYDWNVSSLRDWFELLFLLIGGSLVVVSMDTLQKNVQLIRSVRESAVQQRQIMQDVLANITQHRFHLCDSPDQLPVRKSQVGYPISLNIAALPDLDRKIQEVALAIAFPAERSQALTLAAREAAQNAIAHARAGQGRVCVDIDQGTIQVWIQDQGKGIARERLPQLQTPGAPSPAISECGFHRMLRHADRLWLLTGRDGTTLVLEQDRAQNGPAITP